MTAPCIGGCLSVPAGLDFTVSCVPPTANHQRKQIVRVGKWTRLADKPELVAAKDMLDALLLPHQPPAPVPGTVSLRVEFTWPWLKGQSKRERARGRVPHTGRLDLSNLIKTLEDRLVALRFMEDDCHVAHMELWKWRGDTPGIHVAIAPFGEGR